MGGGAIDATRTIPWPIRMGGSPRWNGRLGLTASPVGGDAGVGQPHAARQFSALPEDINRHAAARIPVACHADELWFDCLLYTLADLECGVLVKSAGLEKAVQELLQRFGFHDPGGGHIMSYEMGEVRLAGDGTKGGEFRRREAHLIIPVPVRIRN